MEQVNIHEAKTNLSRLVDEVANGAENRDRQKRQTHGAIGAVLNGKTRARAGLFKRQNQDGRRF
ncbi:MAG: type II toxin-antitoxin system Phd/YefM family antitoxin [Burkholderiales bacterium]